MAKYHQFEQQLAQAWGPATWCDVTVLVAVSGGADSVALLLALRVISQQSPGQLVAAHFNHGLRGAASEGDAQFVQRLCQRLDLPCESARADTALLSTGDGIEAEARRHRYQFLRAVANRRGARYVATAHTADDQAETILHRVVRGTGLAGLSGIPVTRRLSEMTTIMRPMLSVNRDAALSYLEDRCQPFREDSSNLLTVFTRNRIRHQLMPMLAQQFNAQVVSSLLRLGDLAREAQQVIDATVDPLLETSVICRAAARVDLSRAALCNQPSFLVRELLVRIWKLQCWPRQDMGEARWSELCNLIQSNKPRPPGLTLPGNVQVEVNDDVIILRGC